MYLVIKTKKQKWYFQYKTLSICFPLFSKYFLKRFAMRFVDQTHY